MEEYELYEIMEGIEDFFGMSEAYIESNYELGLMYVDLDGKRYRINITEM